VRTRPAARGYVDNGTSPARRRAGTRHARRVLRSRLPGGAAPLQLRDDEDGATTTTTTTDAAGNMAEANVPMD
jgi:hypothetical protein